jgi:xanthine/uracil permease
MTIFLFANVLTSGISLAATLDLHSRRTKFIMAVSLAVGVGVSIWPFAFQDMRGSTYTAHFWTCEDCGETLKGVRDGVSIFLSTGYCVGTIIAMLLNGLLPNDAGVAYSADFHSKYISDEVEVVKEKKLSEEEEEVPAKEDDVDKKVSIEEIEA